MKKTFNVVDMFCGAGGESTGIMRAAMEQDMKVNLFAINHWELALETHATNHPYANHFREDIHCLDPKKVIRKGTVDLLWASPECTFFSIARGAKPCEKQGRISPWTVVKWVETLDVRRFIIENVPEFIHWGA